MSVFESVFDITYDVGESAVCCPFPHHNDTVGDYLEEVPSAHINLEKGVFHCKVCGAGLNAVQFTERFFGCSYSDAEQLSFMFDTDETEADWKKETITPATVALANSLGISDTVIQELQIKTRSIDTQNTLQFPVLVHNTVLDIRGYTPGLPQNQKIKSRTGACGGLIIPYDLWRESNPTRITLICAGEKDMAVARSFGFNAITITGGEAATPKLINAFKNRPCVIAYDNDSAGKRGARVLANFLIEAGALWVKVLTNFHEVCKEPGEDITDFFVKYQKTKDDLIKYIQATSIAVWEKPESRKNLHTVDLLKASAPEYLNKLVQSNIQVVAVTEAAYTIPTHILCKKFKLSERSTDILSLNQVKEWKLTDTNVQDLMYLCDNGLKETQIDANIRVLTKIPPKENFVKIKTLETATIYKLHVTDLFETQSVDVRPMEYTAYSIGSKLESGEKYKITYKLSANPYKGNQLTMIIVAAEQANDSVTNFNIAEHTQQLQEFKNIPGTIEEKITTIVEKAKGLIGYDGNNQLITTIDLAFHTPLYFDFGTFKNIRAYLDTLIIGESRVGKSSTAETLRRTYGLGTFTSLAGNSATVAGLIGGSNKVNGGYQTRAGVIPQNHRGLVLFEEFGKSNTNLSAELTDIRSSNEVRIARVSGNITLPALVRMITLSNVKAQKGFIKPIASYPNGIEVITELVSTAEDIARYDVILVLSDPGNTVINPLWKPLEPFSDEAYRTRIRWIWSRTPEQIVIPEETAQHIVQRANELNKIYDSHIKLFGTEAWKKLTRLAISIAGYVVSTNETCEHIIVQKDHVDFAVTFMQTLYDNETFRLKQYVEQERKYRKTDEAGIKIIQDINWNQPTLIHQLIQVSETSKQTLEAVSGLETKELNVLLKQLAKALMIRFDGNIIIPTERFRKSVIQLNLEIQNPKPLGQEI